MSIGPGTFAVSRRDLARRDRTAQREADRKLKVVDELAAHLLEHGELPEPPPPRREITEWSRKSRANMARALCELDYAPMFDGAGAAAMVTLTYPGDWETVAATGKVAKAHLQELFHRYWRAWGAPLCGVWKQEFQRRGAPHYHLLMVPPLGTADGRSDAAGSGLPFRQWLSVVWADVVDHPDPVQYVNHLRAGTGVDYAEGARARDPRRASVYFAKHGAFRDKEYQHIVPRRWREPGMGPGRFWGYRKLERAVVGVEVSAQDAVLAARTVRRWARAQRTTREVRAPRRKGGRPVAVSWHVIGLAGAQLMETPTPARSRRVRRRVDRLRRGAGWVSVNDGAAFASAIARYLRQCKDSAAAAAHALMADRRAQHA